MKDFNSSERDNIGWSVKMWPSTSNLPLYWEDELTEEDSVKYRRQYTREILSRTKELDFS
jgi:hypothetical protein